MPRVNHKSQGFTLLEVVVTLAVLSISLVTMYQALTSIARGTRVAANYYSALEIAESEMAKLSAKVGNTGGSSGTVDGQFNWRSSAQAYMLPSGSPLARGSLNTLTENSRQPYLLTVNVSWGERQTRELNLNSIKLGNAP